MYGIARARRCWLGGDVVVVGKSRRTLMENAWKQEFRFERKKNLLATKMWCGSRKGGVIFRGQRLVF